MESAVKMYPSLLKLLSKDQLLNELILQLFFQLCNYWINWEQLDSKISVPLLSVMKWEDVSEGYPQLFRLDLSQSKRTGSWDTSKKSHYIPKCILGNCRSLEVLPFWDFWKSDS